jgi:hypothetical protein
MRTQRQLGEANYFFLGVEVDDILEFAHMPAGKKQNQDAPHTHQLKK